MGVRSESRRDGRGFYADASVLLKAIFLIAILVVAGLVGCSRPARSGSLINNYSQAGCIPVTLGTGNGSSPARTWDYTFEISGASTIRVYGRAVPDGRVDARYQSDGKDEIAADAGDYIYPADVRFDRTGEKLYIKASGIPAVFGGPQTWLFEYDLGQRRQTKRERVDPGVLPQECPAANLN
jgi:hypothetical protein